MRGTKAEGGWGMIFTEQTKIHHTSESTPFIELRLWEDQDIPRASEDVRAHEISWRVGGDPIGLFRH
jgi:dimethylamine/trimethylamine dehydrogenase